MDLIIFEEVVKTLPPGEPGSLDDQGYLNSDRTEICVRSALSKAVANQLYKEKVDIEQNQILAALVQEHKKLYKLSSMSPGKFNGTVLYLQDRDHAVTGIETKKNWWRVNIVSVI